MRTLRLSMRALPFVLLGLGIGAVGVRTAVAARYAGVDRVDNAPSIWLAAAACIGALTTLAMAAAFVVGVRRTRDRVWLAALPAAALGTLLWRSVPNPPKEALAVGLLLLLALPLVIVGAVLAGILLAATWFERHASNRTA